MGLGRIIILDLFIQCDFLDDSRNRECLLVRMGVVQNEGGNNGFSDFSFSNIILFIYRLILVYQQTFEGYIVSLLLGFAGLFAFTIHMYFIRVKKRHEFTLPISMFILIGTLILSLTQGVITLYLLFF